jgi:hypothetical protein
VHGDELREGNGSDIARVTLSVVRGRRRAIANNYVANAQGVVSECAPPRTFTMIK